MKSENLLEQMTRELVKELEASGRKVNKSLPKENKIIITFKSKIKSLKKSKKKLNKIQKNN